MPVVGRILHSAPETVKPDLLWNSFILCLSYEAGCPLLGTKMCLFSVILQNIAVSTGSVERVANGESTAGDDTAISKEEENTTGFVKFGWVKGVLVRNLAHLNKKKRK